MRLPRLSSPSLASTQRLPATAGDEPEPAPRLDPPAGPSAASRPRRDPTLPGVLHGLVKPAVAAVVTAMLSVSLLTSPASAQATRAPLEPTPVTAPTTHPRAALGEAVERLLAADLNGDGRIISRGGGGELEGVDALARAVYAYVDFANPTGQYSLWGADSRGVYVEGGLGMGYSFRPKHMTSHGILTESSLRAGVTLLERAITNPRVDQASQDLASIREAAIAQLGLSPAEVDGAIWTASNQLLDQLKAMNAAKERALSRDDAAVTRDEALAGLPAGSLERLIAEHTLGKEQRFFASALREMSARRAAFGGAPRDQTGLAGDAALQYILVVGKRAMEAELVGRVLEQLPR